tara:strand:+ start:371 stop:781 length:411 start_codon:yes stop_codon:yes gene_type:complete
MADEKITIKKKEFKFKGKSLEELKQLDIREFAKLLKSNEKRTALRQTDEIQRFVLKCKKKTEKKKQIKTHSRYLVIIPQMVGYTVMVYNGKIFVPVQIIGEMLGHRLGEFSVTRTKVKHGAAGVGATRGSASMSVK